MNTNDFDLYGIRWLTNTFGIGARHFVELHLVECNVTSNVTIGRKNYRTTTFGRFFFLVINCDTFSNFDHVQTLHPFYVMHDSR